MEEGIEHSLLKPETLFRMVSEDIRFYLENLCSKLKFHIPNENSHD